MKAKDDDDRRFPFTSPKLDALKPPDKGYVEYHDTKGVRGLILVVVHTGGKSFFVKRRVGGVPKRIRIGKYPDISIPIARREAERINGDLALGNDPTAKSAALRDEPTLDKLLELYLESPRKRGGERKEVTKREYRRMIESYLGSFRKRRVSALAQGEFQALTRSVGSKHGTYAANRMVAVVKAIYNFGIDRCQLKIRNPATGVVTFPESDRDRRLWDDEVRLLLDAADAFNAESGGDVRDFIYVSLFTGARKRNVLSMRWEDVLPLERAIWQIPETKNGRPQKVILHPAVIEVLQRRQAMGRKGHYVFPGTGRSGHLADPKRAWSTVLKNAGISDFRIHDLRRTFGSNLLDAGAPLEAVGMSLAHETLDTTRTYARGSMGPLRQAVTAGVDRMLDAAGRAKKDPQSSAGRAKKTASDADGATQSDHRTVPARAPGESTGL